MQSLILALILCGQLPTPLHDASCLYRPQPWDFQNTVIPNEGTRAEPLILGSTLGEDNDDPELVNDQTLGPYLRFVAPDLDHATSPVPPEVMNGDFAFAVRLRKEGGYGAGGALFYIIDTDQYGQTLKRSMTYIDTSNKYYPRFFNTGWGNVATQSTTQTDTNRTDTILVTWDSLTRENRLYVNGFLEDVEISSLPRQDAINPGLKMPPKTSALPASYKWFAAAVWERTLSAEDALNLYLNEEWYAAGGGPPVIPPPPQNRIFIDDVEQLGATIKLNGVILPSPPAGQPDDVYDIYTLAP